MPPHKLLFITPDFNSHGGIQTVSRITHDHFSRLKQQGKLDFETLSDRRIQLMPGAGSINSLARKTVFVLKNWTQSLQNRQFDTILFMHLHFTPLLKLHQTGKAKSYIFLHGTECWRKVTPRERFAVQHSELIANSAYTLRLFLEHNPEFSNRPATLCHLGIPDLSQQAPASIAPPDGPFALIAGRISAAERYKGHEPLLRAWPAVLRRVPQAKLVIVGDGTDRIRLTELTKELGLEKAVIFTGEVSDATLAHFFQRALFFAMPSTHEGFGLVFLEAMRAGKACLAAPGATEEVLRDGVTGQIVPPENAERLIETLLNFFENPERCAAMGTAGREIFLKHFTAAQFTARLDAALKL